MFISKKKCIQPEKTKKNYIRFKKETQHNILITNNITINKLKTLSSKRGHDHKVVCSVGKKLEINKLPIITYYKITYTLYFLHTK